MIVLSTWFVSSTFAKGSLQPVKSIMQSFFTIQWKLPTSRNLYCGLSFKPHQSRLPEKINKTAEHLVRVLDPCYHPVAIDSVGLFGCGGWIQIAPGTNLRSGSVFVSLGETFRREGRNVVDNLLPLTALLLKGQSYCEIPAAKIWPPAQGPVRDCIRPKLASDQCKRIWERC